MQRMFSLAVVLLGLTAAHAQTGMQLNDQTSSGTGVAADPLRDIPVAVVTRLSTWRRSDGTCHGNDERGRIVGIDHRTGIDQPTSAPAIAGRGARCVDPSCEVRDVGIGIGGGSCLLGRDLRPASPFNGWGICERDRIGRRWVAQRMLKLQAQPAKVCADAPTPPSEDWPNRRAFIRFLTGACAY